MADGEDGVDDGKAARVVDEENQAVTHHRHELKHLKKYAIYIKVFVIKMF